MDHHNWNDAIEAVFAQCGGYCRDPALRAAREVVLQLRFPELAIGILHGGSTTRGASDFLVGNVVVHVSHAAV